MDRLHNTFPKQNVHIYNLHESIWQHFSPFSARTTAEALHNSRLGDRKIWPLKRVDHCREVYTRINGMSTKKSSRCGKVDVSGGSTVLVFPDNLWVSFATCTDFFLVSNTFQFFPDHGHSVFVSFTPV